MFKNKDKIKGKLAIFAGRGNLPKILIAECLKNKQEFCLFLLDVIERCTSVHDYEL